MVDDSKRLAIQSLAQECCKLNPVIVLGSGASNAHGIGGMPELAEYLMTQLSRSNKRADGAWTRIESALKQGMGLEAALQSTKVPKRLLTKITQLTWRLIAGDDEKLMLRAVNGEVDFPLSHFIRWVLRSNVKTVNIVTPNYDRVAEYAVDMTEYSHATGFTDGIIRYRKSAEELIPRGIRSAAKTVNIWKVHGSIDWFSDNTGTSISIPIRRWIPKELSPLMIAPGYHKFEQAFDEPFRTIIQSADRALAHAKAYLCVGYGFGDTHIQPKLIEQCKRRNVPIVVLAKSLTRGAKEFLRTGAGTRYLALESSARGGSRFYTEEKKDGEDISEPNLWTLDAFNQFSL